MFNAAKVCSMSLIDPFALKRAVKSIHARNELMNQLSLINVNEKNAFYNLTLAFWLGANHIINILKDNGIFSIKRTDVWLICTLVIIVYYSSTSN